MAASLRERSVVAATFAGALALLWFFVTPGADRAAATVLDALLFGAAGIAERPPATGYVETVAYWFALLFTLWIAAEVTAIRLHGFDVVRRGTWRRMAARYVGLWLLVPFTFAGTDSLLVRLLTAEGAMSTPGRGMVLLYGVVGGVFVALAVRGTLEGYRSATGA